jgi:DNA-binding response OmpR family regulator
VRALGRRVPELRPVVLQFHDLTLDSATRRVERAGQPVVLSAREFRLLEFLVSSPGRVRSREAILEMVCDYDHDPGSSLVENLVRQLRAKVDAPFESKLIRTVPGVGYTMRAES